MNREIARALALASVLGSFGCINFNFFEDRIDVKAGDKQGLNPGVSATWQVLPRSQEPRQGLFRMGEDVQQSTPSSPADASNRTTPGRDATEVDGAAGDPAAPKPTAPEAHERSWFQPSLSIDFDYRAGVAGSDARSMDDEEYLDYDGQRFLGPEQLDYDYTLHVGSVSARGGARFLDVVGLYMLGGLSTSALQLEVDAPGERAGDTGVSLGAHWGWRAVLTPHPVLDLYGQWQLHLLAGLSSNRESVFMNTSEVGANVHLTQTFSVFGGWRWWDYEEVVDGESDLDVDLSGPTFGLLFRF